MRHRHGMPLLIALLFFVFSLTLLAQTPYLVKDIAPGSTSSAPDRLFDFKGQLLLEASEGLWISDGTEAGTSLLKNTGPIESNLLKLGGKALFVAHKYLWTTDGTSQGTAQIKKLHNDDGFIVSNLAEFNGAALFTIWEPGHRTVTLWKSDGTESGTQIIEDLCSSRCMTLSQVVVAENAAYFVTADNGFKLWKTDGTAAGTQVMRSFSVLGNLVNVNGTVFFAADDGTNGTELWKTDGSLAGTVMVKDICAGSCGGNPVLFSNAVSNGTFYFAVVDLKRGVSLWKSDGSRNGTVMVKDVVPGLTLTPTDSFASLNGKLYFAGFNTQTWTELWKTDGTTDGTVMVKDICPRCASLPSSLTTLNGTIFFAAADDTHGVELWKTDGTAEKTVMLADIKPQAGSSAPSDLIAIGNKVFFAADDGQHGRELWALDVAPLPPPPLPPAAEPVSLTPTVDSVSPVGGSGNTTFTFTFSDPSGYANLTQVQGVINGTMSYAGACSFVYYPSRNTIHVFSDDGSVRVNPGAIVGQPGTVGNSQCTIDAAAASVSASGNQLALTLPVSFSSNFVGERYIYAYAANAVARSGWQKMGSWTPVPSVPNIPAVDAVTPNASKGLAQSLTFQFSSANGYSYIEWVQGIINASPSYVSSCSFYYQRATNRLFLMNDAGDSWIGPATPGVAGTLSNTQCTIDAAKSSVSGAGSTLSLTIAATATSTVVGTQNIYGYAADHADQRSGWMLLGTWLPNPPLVATAPKAVSITNVPGLTTFVFASDNGGAYITAVQTIIATSFGYPNACSLYYFPASNQISLMNDTGDKWSTRLTLGQPGTLSNSQCTIDVASSSATVSGDNLVLNVANTYAPGFTGSRHAWGYAIDKVNAKSWTDLGSLTLQ